MPTPADPFPGLKELTRLFKSLADRHRLHILHLLASAGEMNVSAISDELGQAQPAVSHHLNRLRAVGLVAFRKDGKFNWYSLGNTGLRAVFDRLFPDGGPAKVALGGVEVSVKPKK